MLTLEQVQKDPYVLAFINHSNRTLDMQGFTEHGVRHARLVAERARMIAMKIGLSARAQDFVMTWRTLSAAPSITTGGACSW